MVAIRLANPTALDSVAPMTAPYRLHYAPDNASLCVRLALEELGVAYDTVLVDRAVRGQKAPSYLALNPNGLIPVLETPLGPLFETGAILLWLADTHFGLAPAQSHPDRGPVLTWHFWLSNTLHPSLRMLFYPGLYGPAEGVRAATIVRLRDLLTMLECEPTGWLDRPSILSCYAAPMLRWLAIYPPGHTDWFHLPKYPRLEHMARMMEDRRSARAAILAEGLGPYPFTDPRPPNPPEGSAT